MEKVAVLVGVILFLCCSSSRGIAENPTALQQSYSILTLGDSYTIGESVCNTCKFPEQLKDSLLARNNNNGTIKLDVIAKTGWTTSDLKSAIHRQNSTVNYDLVTLLIGVNNQYQNKPFSIYEIEFPELVAMAIKRVSGDKNKLIVLSIPDYAYTPFGKGNQKISKEIDRYNAFAENYCKQNSIKYINITPVTRQGISQPNLVASDGLHPSKWAYGKFVEQLLPFASKIIK